MSVATTPPVEALAVCAELIEWSQGVGLPGDYVRLWRKHEAVFQRIHVLASRRGAGAIYQLRYLELEIWVDTLHRSLRTEILERVATSFSSGRGSALLAGLGPERRRQVARARKAHACSADASLITALLRFQRSPALIYLAEALRALGDVVDIRSARTEGFNAEQLSEGLERLAYVIGEEIPPVACEVVALEVEERFAGRVDRSWFHDVNITRSRFGQEPPWTPTWKEFGSSYGPVEPTGMWFVPEMQARYEERRLAREIEQGHTEAGAEERRRANEIEEERRQRDEERRAAEEKDRLELAVRKRKENHRLVKQRAHEEAPRVAQAEMVAQGLTLKHIPEPERTAKIREVEGRLISRLEGRRDKKGH